MAAIAAAPRDGSPPVRLIAKSVRRCMFSEPRVATNAMAAIARAAHSTANDVSARRRAKRCLLSTCYQAPADQPQRRDEIDDAGRNPHHETGELLILQPGQATDREGI